MLASFDRAGHGRGNLLWWYALLSRPRRFARFFDQVIEKLRVGRSRIDKEKIDAKPGKLGTDRLAPAGQGEFARTVFAVVRYAAPAEDRTDVHDDWLPALLQEGPLSQEGYCHARQFRGGKEVDLHDLSEAFLSGIGKATVGARAGIVDEEIETPQLFARGGDGSGSRGRMRDIAGDGNRRRSTPC